MNNDYWINRRTLRQEIALAIRDYKTRKIVQAVIDSIPHIDLLERDEGKEPILEEGRSTYHVLREDGTGGFETNEYLAWECPVCGWFVGELYSGHGMWHVQGETSYCARCGQRIDWTKPDEEEKRRYEERKAKEREEYERRHGRRLDNMHEGKRRKYGVVKDEQETNDHSTDDDGEENR